VFVTNWRWTEKADTEGTFWIPGNDEPFYVRLQHDPREGIGMHLYDVRQSVRSPGSSPPIPSNSALFGVLPGGVPASATGFFATKSLTTGFPPAATTTLDGFCQSLLIGLHLENDDLLTADGFGAELRGLDTTLTGAAGEPGLLNPHAGGGVGPTADGEWRDFVLPDGAKLTLHAGERGSTGFRRTTTEVHASLFVAAPEVVSSVLLEERYLEPLREFVTFCRRATTYVEALRFAGGEAGSDVPILRRPYPYPRQPQRDDYRLGLNLARV